MCVACLSHARTHTHTKSRLKEMIRWKEEGTQKRRLKDTRYTRAVTIQYTDGNGSVVMCTKPKYTGIQQYTAHTGAR